MNTRNDESEYQKLMRRVYRLRSDMVQEGFKIRAPSDLVPMLDQYSDKEQEHFIVVFLDGAHATIGHQVVMGHQVVTKGLVNRTVVHPREVFRPAIAKNCVAIILAHNHPSGSLEPSSEDDAVTKRLVQGGELLGIAVLDHIIIGRRGFYSYLEHDRL